MNLVLPRGGLLINIGTDLVEVERVRRVVERQGERFLHRVFTEEEREYCLRMPHPHRHLAARFAAKEAVSKAFTTGIGAEFGWKTASVYKGERKEPYVRLDPQGDALLRRVGANLVLLSLSHTDQHAMAVAALVREE